MPRSGRRSGLVAKAQRIGAVAESPAGERHDEVDYGVGLGYGGCQPCFEAHLGERGSRHCIAYTTSGLGTGSSSKREPQPSSRAKVAERTVEFAQRLVFVFERDLVGLVVPAHQVQCALEDDAEGLVHSRGARSREGADPSP